MERRPTGIDGQAPLLTPPAFLAFFLAGATGNSEEVRTLADEVMAHLRGLVGADALLAAYQAARGVVRRQRGDRKRAAAVQVRTIPPGGGGGGCGVCVWGGGAGFLFMRGGGMCVSRCPAAALITLPVL